jgi:hypothetical protein
MILLNPNDWVLYGFEVSKRKNKKYDAIMLNKYDQSIKKIPFGDTRFQQYHDRLGHYKALDHKDKVRRLNYKRRHAKDIMNKYSSGWFAFYYLW